MQRLAKLNKRGYSLVELVVAMGIFIVVTTLAIGAFVAVSRTKALTSTIKESQQKTRIALEMITRLARQAEKVIISDNGDTLELYFEIKSTSPYGARFRIDNNGLYYDECQGALNCSNTDSDTSNDWKNETNLYSGINLINDPLSLKDSMFVKGATVPPTLDVKIYGQIESQTNNPYYEDEINLDTKIILEAIK